MHGVRESAQQVGDELRRPGRVLRRVLPAVLSGVVLLVLADAAHRAGWPAFAHWRWNAAPEASWMELLRAVLMLVAGGLLVREGVRCRRAAVLTVWAGALLVLVVDDLIGVHEALGTALARGLGLTALGALRGQDQGELVAWAVIGVVLGGAVVVAHRLSGPEARAASWLVGLGVGVQAFSAVVLDGVGALVAGERGTATYHLAAAVEFTGETLGAVCVVVVALALRAQPRISGSHAGQSSATGSFDSDTRTSTLVEVSGSPR